MKYRNYPILYQDADKASNIAQKNYLRYIKLNIFSLFLGTLLSFLSINSNYILILSVLCFFSSLIFVIIIFLKKDQDIWYCFRSISESIKTLTWRFMMKVEPFGIKLNFENAKNKFCNLLSEILKDNKAYFQNIKISYSNNGQISDEMIRIRDLGFISKKKIYLKKRLVDQKKWYSDKSKKFSLYYKLFFIPLILCQIFATISVILKFVYPNYIYLPTEIFSFLCASLLSWIQVKKYKELSSIYSFTAHEIGIIQAKYVIIKNKSELSQFIQDAENAFSREHTQWLARRDY